MQRKPIKMNKILHYGDVLYHEDEVVTVITEKQVGDCVRVQRGIGLSFLDEFLVRKSKLSYPTREESGVIMARIMFGPRLC